MEIWCDGGNNKIAMSCVILENGRKYLLREKRSTNNIMEYKAMLKALEIATDGDIIYSDSQLVVYQILGWWQVKQYHLKIFYQKCEKILAEKKVYIKWVPRRKNIAGKLIDRKYIQRKNKYNVRKEL
jgi:ribonuclease HI